MRSTRASAAVMTVLCFAACPGLLPANRCTSDADCAQPNRCVDSRCGPATASSSGDGASGKSSSAPVPSSSRSQPSSAAPGSSASVDQVSSSLGIASSLCIPDCAAHLCGDDGCGGSCGDCDDGNSCTIDHCAQGQCLHQDVDDATPCDDGNFCTMTDTCVAAVCTGSGTPCMASNCDETRDRCFICTTAAECDDGNPCTTEACAAGGACTHTPVANETVCDDGVWCTLDDTCVNGACEGSGSPCPPSMLRCDEANRTCRECLEDAHCDDGNACTGDLCLPSGCMHENLVNVACDDGRFCTLVDACVNGACMGEGSPCMSTAPYCNDATSSCGTCDADMQCDDANVCTVDSCVDNTCSNTPVVDGTMCDDGKFCTLTDRCQDGTCAGTGSPCPSTRPFCNAANSMCDACTTDAQCDDANTCTTDTCSTGMCSHAPVTNGIACSDGKYCTVTDTCMAGVCAGAGARCSGSTPICIEAADRCGQCASDANCPSNKRCSNYACVCRSSAPEADCNDGKDNDCDGKVDCADSDCAYDVCGSTSNYRCCGTSCVNLNTNANNCGACGLDCGSHACRYEGGHARCECSANSQCAAGGLNATCYQSRCNCLDNGACPGPESCNTGVTGPNYCYFP